MLFTFGHSTLSAEDGLGLLLRNEIGLLIDVRSHPTSKWEQWRIENTEIECRKRGIEYEWWPELGGWNVEHGRYTESMKQYGVDVEIYRQGKFPKQRIGKSSGEMGWTNQGLWDYQFFMTTDEFKDGVGRLMELKVNAAIMCAELLWWKCHRSMIADYVVVNGREIVHLQPRMMRHSKVLGNRIERYHPDTLVRK